MGTRRKGFTLVELLVVIGILLAITGLVITAFRPTASSVMRDAGRIAQSAVLGARDRALHAKARRGFRLLIDPADPNIATGFLYLQPIEVQTYGPQAIQLERPDNDGDGTLDSNDVVIVHGFRTLPPPEPNVDWPTIQPFFSEPPRVRIPAGTGNWYTFFVPTTGAYVTTASDTYLWLTTPFVDSGAPGQIAHPRVSATFSSCDIEMAPEIMPNSQPISLPSGIVIDLNLSSQSARQSIMFSPRGMVAGSLSGLGPIHLLLRDVRDYTEGRDPADQGLVGDQSVLTLNPQTGHCQTYPVDPTDADSDGIADDPFRFAKTGSRQGG